MKPIEVAALPLLPSPVQDIPGGPVLMESRYTQAGRNMAVCNGTPAGSLGISTCYDLRFPEMYACLAGQGAQVRARFFQSPWEIVRARQDLVD